MANKPIKYGLERKTQDSLDSHYILGSSYTNPWDDGAISQYICYEGFQVYAPSNDTVYVYIGASVTEALIETEASWLALGSFDATSDYDFSGDNNFNWDGTNVTGSTTIYTDDTASDIVISGITNERPSVSFLSPTSLTVPGIQRFFVGDLTNERGQIQFTRASGSDYGFLFRGWTGSALSDFLDIDNAGLRVQGGTNVLTNARIGFLSTSGLSGTDFVKLANINASSTEINLLQGVTGTLVTSGGAGINGTPTEGQVATWDNANSRLYWSTVTSGGNTLTAGDGIDITSEVVSIDEAHTNEWSVRQDFGNNIKLAKSSASILDFERQSDGTGTIGELLYRGGVETVYDDPSQNGNMYYSQQSDSAVTDYFVLVTAATADNTIGQDFGNYPAQGDGWDTIAQIKMTGDDTDNLAGAEANLATNRTVYPFIYVNSTNYAYYEGFVSNIGNNSSEYTSVTISSVIASMGTIPAEGEEGISAADFDSSTNTFTKDSNDGIDGSHDTDFDYAKIIAYPKSDSDTDRRGQIDFIVADKTGSSTKTIVEADEVKLRIDDDNVEILNADLTLGNRLGDAFIGTNADGEIIDASSTLASTTVTGLVSHDGDQTFGGVKRFSGAVHFNDNVDLGNTSSDAITVDGQMTINQLLTINNDTTVNINTGDVLQILDGVDGTFLHISPNGFLIQSGMTVSGGTSTFSSDAVFNEDVTIGNTSSDSLTVTATANFQNNVTLGSGGSDTLTANTISTFQGNTSFNANVTLGNAIGDDITVTGLSTFTGVDDSTRDGLTAAAGMFIYNSDDNEFQYYDGTSWGSIGGADLTNYVTRNTDQTISGEKTFDNDVIVRDNTAGTGDKANILKFVAQNDNSAQIDYAEIITHVQDDGDGTEIGGLKIKVQHDEFTAGVAQVTDINLSGTGNEDVTYTFTRLDGTTQDFTYSRTDIASNDASGMITAINADSDLGFITASATGGSTTVTVTWNTPGAVTGNGVTGNPANRQLILEATEGADPIGVEYAMTINTSTDNVETAEFTDNDVEAILDIRTNHDGMHVIVDDNGLYIPDDKSIGIYETGTDALGVPQIHTKLEAGIITVENVDTTNAKIRGRYNGTHDNEDTDLLDLVALSGTGDTAPEVAGISIGGDNLDGNNQDGVISFRLSSNVGAGSTHILSSSDDILLMKIDEVLASNSWKWGSTTLNLTNAIDSTNPTVDFNYPIIGPLWRSASSGQLVDNMVVHDSSTLADGTVEYQQNFYINYLDDSDDIQDPKTDGETVRQEIVYRQDSGSPADYFGEWRIRTRDVDRSNGTSTGSWNTNISADPSATTISNPVLTGLSGSGSHLTIDSSGVLQRATISGGGVAFDRTANYTGSNSITGNWEFDGNVTIGDSDSDELTITSDIKSTLTMNTSLPLMIFEDTDTAETDQHIASFIFRGTKSGSSSQTEYARLIATTPNINSDESERGGGLILRTHGVDNDDFDGVYVNGDVNQVHLGGDTHINVDTASGSTDDAGILRFYNSGTSNIGGDDQKVGRVQFTGQTASNTDNKINYASVLGEISQASATENYGRLIIEAHAHSEDWQAIKIDARDSDNSNDRTITFGTGSGQDSIFKTTTIFEADSLFEEDVTIENGIAIQTAGTLTVNRPSVFGDGHSVQLRSDTIEFAKAGSVDGNYTNLQNDNVPEIQALDASVLDGLTYEVGDGGSTTTRFATYDNGMSWTNSNHVLYKERHRSVINDEDDNKNFNAGEGWMFVDDVVASHQHSGYDEYRTFKRVFGRDRDNAGAVAHVEDLQPTAESSGETNTRTATLTNVDGHQVTISWTNTDSNTTNASRIKTALDALSGDDDFVSSVVQGSIEVRCTWDDTGSFGGSNTDYAATMSHGSTFIETPGSDGTNLGDSVHRTEVYQSASQFHVAYNDDTNDDDFDNATTLLQVERGDTFILTYAEVISGSVGNSGTVSNASSNNEYLEYTYGGQTYYRVFRHPNDTDTTFDGDEQIWDNTDNNIKNIIATKNY